MDLSIIILSFNTKKLTQQCINSILRNTKSIKYEIIVIDNASSDGSVEDLRKFKERQNLRLIENAENLGFARANNQGMRVAKGRYVLLLNSDTKISDNLLKELVNWMDKHPKVGISSCALKNKDGSMQGTGGFFPDLFRVFAWMFFLEDIPFWDRLIKPFHPIHSQSPFYKGTKGFEKEKDLDWVTGAFFLIRKKVLDEVGYLDEDYFMYTEDVDLCFRAKEAGWKIWYLPRVSITHLGGASSASEFPILSEYEGIKLFYKKHKAPWQYPLVRILLKIGSLMRVVIFGTFLRKGAVKTYAKALIHT